MRQPTVQVRYLKGTLRSGDGESTCNVSQRIAGQQGAAYYTNPTIDDSSVSPPMSDGEYRFHYLGEPDSRVVVTRQDGAWLGTPASTRTPA